MDAFKTPTVAGNGMSPLYSLRIQLMRTAIRAVMSFVLVLAVHGKAVAEDPAIVSAGTGSRILFPLGDLFKPLIADPKEPRFYLSYRLFRVGSDSNHAAVGGYGEFFGITRHMAAADGYSWQSSFGGGIHAQFDLHAPSLDLVNTDYTIGFPFTFRKGEDSYRIMLYHQSSHLGDEYMLHHTIDRLELSYEAVEILASREWQAWRLYYGGECMVHKEPHNLKPLALQGGVEYYGRDRVLGSGRMVGGMDLKSDQQHKWSLNMSVKAGLQFDGTTDNGRYLRLLAEVYKGFNPYGQFYENRITYIGIGIYLGFE